MTGQARDRESPRVPAPARGPQAARTNVAGQPLARPKTGFGPLWHKSYSVRFAATLTPEALAREWREHFDEFWPKDNRFFQPLTGIRPGEVAAIDLPLPGGARLSTGMAVVDVQPCSFTMITPRGHMFAGKITFATQPCGGQAQATIDILARSGDPLYEFGLRLGGHRREDAFWSHNLSCLAARYGSGAHVVRSARILDPRIQWRSATNVVANAALRTSLQRAASFSRQAITNTVRFARGSR